jgi:hypothetical protein
VKLATAPNQIDSPSGESVACANFRRAESGFAYLLAMMMVVAVIIASSVALEKGIAQARRQREALAIWRGEQYVRAIRLYYKKTQHYPQTVEDLQKGNLNIHFLRPEAFKNPMNKQDGSWRLIYVNPAGQIIGSVRYANLQQMALIVLNNGQMPTIPTGQPGAATTPGAPVAPTSPAPPNNTAGNGGDTSQSPEPNSGDQQPEPPPADPQGALPQTPQGLPPNAMNSLLTMKPTGPVSGPVVGGFLTGVALTPDKPSQRVYQGGKKYIQWEFIWNPMVDQARAVQAGGSGAATGSIGGAAGTPGGILGGTGNGTNGGGGLFPTQPGQPPTQTPPQPSQPPPQIPQ